MVKKRLNKKGQEGILSWEYILIVLGIIMVAGVLYVIIMGLRNVPE